MEEGRREPLPDRSAELTPKPSPWEGEGRNRTGRMPVPPI